MPLDDATPLAPMQSQTIRAVLGIIVTNVAATMTQLGMSAVTVNEFTQVANIFISIACNIITLYFAYKAYHGRMNATQTIRKESAPCQEPATSKNPPSPSKSSPG